MESRLKTDDKTVTSYSISQLVTSLDVDETGVVLSNAFTLNVGKIKNLNKFNN